MDIFSPESFAKRAPIIGWFLVGEGLASVLFSQDRRGISQFGRVLRIAAGIYLIGPVSIKLGAASNRKYLK